MSLNHNHTDNEKYVVAVEIGSSRAKMGIASYIPGDERHSLRVHSVTSLPTVNGVRYGRISNIVQVTEVVKTLLDGMDKQYPIEGRAIHSVYVSLGGRTLKSRRLTSKIVLADRREITEDHLIQLENEAVSQLSNPDELLCIEPVDIKIDGISTPRPVGTLGTRMSGEYTAVLCDPSNRADITEVLESRVLIGICGTSVRPLAMAHLVLSPQEIKAGCMLVDVGAETLTVSIFTDYALRYIATIPIGSRLITRDLAACLSLTEDDAEMLKLTQANAVPEGSQRTSEQRAIDDIVTSRLADIVVNIEAQPGFAGISKLDLSAGIILTGGGAKMQNFARLLETATGLTVRMATLPPEISIMDSSLSAADNLDIIALLNDGAEASRMRNNSECVGPKHEPHLDVPTPEPEPEPEVERTTSYPAEELIFDYDTPRTPRAKQEPTDFLDPYAPHGHGLYEEEDPTANTAVRMPYVDPYGDSTDFDDDYLLNDDEEAARKRERDREYNKKKQERELKKEQARARRYEERQKRLAQQKEQRETEEEQEEQDGRISGGLASSIQRIVTMAEIFMRKRGEDNSTNI